MRSKGRIILAVVCCAAGLVGASAARADFVAVEDFDALNLAAISGQNGWASDSGGNVVTDPAGGTNQVLAITGTSYDAYKGATIANGTSATLFARVRFTGPKNYSFGMTDIAAPNLAGGDFGVFESQLNMNNTANDLRIRDGSLFDVLTALSADTWYNVWMVIDNTTDKTTVYLHATDGAAAGAGDVLANGAQTAFTFRNSGGGAVANNLVNFFIKTGAGNGTTEEAQTGSLYLDDLYLDTAGLNLANPVPEPATLGLLAFGGLAALARRRRR